MRPSTLEQTVTRLRTQHAARNTTYTRSRAAAALAATARLWDERLRANWTPPGESPFPWPMVRYSLQALLPGLRDAEGWLARTTPDLPFANRRGPAVVAHVLAGNTPLLSWPGLAACVLAGSSSFVKMSRTETVWPRRFVDALAAVDAELAQGIVLDVWPGNDARTRELVQAADAVIAYGSDATLAAVRAATLPDRLFLGFGHALSVGLLLADADIDVAAAGFARDTLLYDQGGCLSPHAFFVEGGGERTATFGDRLALALTAEADALQVGPVVEAGVALAVWQARDLALFRPDATVRGDPALRWTVIRYGQERSMDAPIAHGVAVVLPLADVAENFGAVLGAVRGRLSSVGVAGVLSNAARAAVLSEGVSRVCAPGTMQTPPLDWPNNNRDLLASLLGKPG